MQQPPPTMNAMIQNPLTTLQTQLNSLLTSVHSTPTAGPARHITHKLLAADLVLTSALSTLRTHQANYAQILELRKEVEDLEQRIKDRVKGLDQLRVEALSVYQDAGSDTDSDDADENEAAGRSKEGVDYRTLMAFSRRIGRFPESTASTIPSIPITLQTTNGANGMQAFAGPKNITAPFSAISTLDETTTNWLDQAGLIHNLSLSAPFPDVDQIRRGMLGKAQLAVEDGHDVDELVRGLMGMSGEETTKGEDGDGDAQMGGMDQRRVSFGLTVGASSAASSSRAPEERKKATRLDLGESDSDEEE